MAKRLAMSILNEIMLSEKGKTAEDHVIIIVIEKPTEELKDDNEEEQ